MQYGFENNCAGRRPHSEKEMPPGDELRRARPSFWTTCCDTLEDAEGYGLAAPQVGVMRRVFVSVDERDLPENGERPEGYKTKFLEFVNPEIIAQEGDVLQYEGCLSFPGHNAAIHRPARVTVCAFDRDGNPFTLEAEGMLARCICHESDHLDGVTIMEKGRVFL